MVQCARCTPEDLVNFIKSIKAGIKMEDTRRNVQAALDQLSSQCLEWDCSADNKAKLYTEYCEVKASLEQSLLYLSQSETQVSK